METEVNVQLYVHRAYSVFVDLMLQVLRERGGTLDVLVYLGTGVDLVIVDHQDLQVDSI